MENCTIYSHQLEFDQVIEIVKYQLPQAKVQVRDGGKQKGLIASIKGGLFGKTKTLKINYRERENPSYKLDKVECGLTQNLAGMVNFVQSLPAENKELRNKFVHKVMSANCEMPFMAEPGITKEFAKILRRLSSELDAFIFAQPNKFFKKSDDQHFLDKNLDMIIDASGTMEINDIDVKVDAKYYDEPKEEYTDEQLVRKSNSESILSAHGIKVNANLPCVPDSSNVSLRTKEEVINRAYSLMIIAVYGEGINKDQLKKPIAEKEINGFTPKEQYLLSLEEMNEQQKAYCTWRYESFYTILWALRIFNELKFPSEICNVQEVVSSILQPSRIELEERSELRSTEEILNELDKTFRMNWACVDARIKDEQVSGSINPSIIYERHYALNWLIRYQNQDWDDVQTNT